LDYKNEELNYKNENLQELDYKNENLEEYIEGIDDYEKDYVENLKLEIKILKEKIDNEKDIKKEYKYSNEEDNFYKNFDYEKFENLKLNQHNLHWYIFYRNFIYPQLKLFKKIKNGVIEKYSNYKNIEKKEIGFNKNVLQKFLSTSLFIDSKLCETKFGVSKFEG